MSDLFLSCNVAVCLGRHRDSVHGPYYPYYWFCEASQKVFLSGAHCHETCNGRHCEFPQGAEQVQYHGGTIFCEWCQIYLKPGVTLHKHYVESVLHPSPCGACMTGFANLEGYEKHVKKCPALLYGRYEHYYDGKPEEMIAKVEREHSQPQDSEMRPMLPLRPGRLIMPAVPVESLGEQAEGAEPTFEASTGRGSPPSTSDSEFKLYCRICRGAQMRDPVVTPCGHVFCQRCIGEELMGRTDCPVCHRSLLLRLAMD
ncbi:hypothetical protein L226DRAFT_168533 [Lentinus tigrinus ALCF2SS1-7]|uniref:uncharacterized protein n=1 Tax=Lentinus tigrinus ALCF2SS1-7 TaxID=1328758 RepID=UPI001165DE38|nr:hypothetical protein L226DRAFT_168533 [Lentinus tigrinus ALCF2SS1-7]